MRPCVVGSASGSAARGLEPDALSRSQVDPGRLGAAGRGRRRCSRRTPPAGGHSRSVWPQLAGASTTTGLARRSTRGQSGGTRTATPLKATVRQPLVSATGPRCRARRAPESVKEPRTRLRSRLDHVRRRLPGVAVAAGGEPARSVAPPEPQHRPRTEGVARRLPVEVHRQDHGVLGLSLVTGLHQGPVRRDGEADRLRSRGPSNRPARPASGSSSPRGVSQSSRSGTVVPVTTVRGGSERVATTPSATTSSTTAATASQRRDRRRPGTSGCPSHLVEGDRVGRAVDVAAESGHRDQTSSVTPRAARSFGRPRSRYDWIDETDRSVMSATSR